MYKLVLKDLIIHKSMIIITFIYGILFSIAASYIQEFSYYIYILAIVLITILSVSMTNYYDDKNNTEILLTSFPLRKYDIVIGKYLSLIVFWFLNTIIITICLLFCSYFISKSTVILVNWRYSIYALYIIASIFSVYYPLLFKLGYIKMRVVNALLYILLFVIPKGINQLILKATTYNSVKVMMMKLIPIVRFVVKYPLVISLFFIFILIFSAKISIKIYDRRDM